MAIDHQIYDTATLLEVIRDDEFMKPPEHYWLDMFTEQINFTDEYVDFGKISDNRKLAPLVVPTVQGVPMYSAAERLERVKPAYVKPKDPVSASRVLRRAAGLGELGTGATPLSPQARYDAIVADIQRTHRFGIERRWEWLAAKAIIDASVTLEDERYPKTVIDFGRAANLTVTLTGGNQWGDNGVSIIASLFDFRERVRLAPYGGRVNRLTVGSAVWNVMRDDTEFMELLKTEYRPNNNGLNINLGLREGGDVEFVGSISGTLPVYVYSDFYQDDSGTVVPFMSPKDIVLTGPNIHGVRCFGAIQDIEAGFAALPIFPKMWNEKDPSATVIMNQSAPLMVPRNPNNTLKATVVA